MELYSHEQRQERGRILAQEHHVVEGAHSDGDRLLKRLRLNESVLRAVHRKLVDDVNEKAPITSVGEWLVDNFYVIEEQISLSLRHLPRKYLMELPRLDNPGRAGIPRVYDLAEHIIAYGDSRVDIEDVSVVITAYQQTTPLKLGELWATPIMLRLALVENIRRIAEAADRSRADRESARRWAEALVRVEEKDPKSLVLTIADMARNGPRLTGSFVAEFKRLLQGRGTGMKLPLQWVEQNLNERGQSVEQTVSDENHEQAVSEISMRNCVNSLRSLNVTDWNEFVETMSRVEQLLRKDPGDVYGKMDFSTRDDYRRAVESLAKGSGRDEPAVAATCLDLAREAATTLGASSPAAHVGYYLIGDGESRLRRAVGYRGGVGDLLRDASTRFKLSLYLGAILVLTVLFTAVTAAVAHAGGVQGTMLALLTVLLAFATCHLAVALVNFLATQLVRPRSLPRLNYSKGIPAEARTMAVVPVIVSNEKGVGAMLRTLETHYLNNRGLHIHFALLTDFADAATEKMPEDDRLLNLCRLGIMKLNDKYPEDGGDNFLLFHRPRKWNPVEKVWMARAAELAENIESQAWDDAWYRRAYFDDGTPLGSAQNDECRIDSIVQSWSVLSGVGSEKRCRQAMKTLDENLIDRENMVVKLFAPPFDNGVLKPGYIGGYVPGVRENGGQYTHGAIWAGMAFAKLRDRKKTWELQRLLNPVSHALTSEWAEKYMVEPYVVSADVYANPQHRGRGGWSWYTGSAAWLYRFMLESVLGFNLEADAIKLDPCVPEEWKGFRIRFRRRQTTHDITVSRSRGDLSTRTVTMDGVDKGDTRIRIAEDAREHRVEVRM